WIKREGQQSIIFPIACAGWLMVAIVVLACLFFSVKARWTRGLRISLRGLFLLVTLVAFPLVAIPALIQFTQIAERGGVYRLFPERGWRELGPNLQYRMTRGETNLANTRIRTMEGERQRVYEPTGDKAWENSFTKKLSDAYNAPLGSFKYAWLQWLVGYGPYVTIPLALGLIAVARWFGGRAREGREAESSGERAAGIVRAAYRSCCAAAYLCLVVHLVCVPAIFPELEEAYEQDMAFLRDPLAAEREAWQAIEPEISAYCEKYGIERPDEAD
ncbi:MAG: hypothetical protein KDA42_13335, partial [Planctomycetales bacterium]|nr:hypothetical protein [Planctomycetales bacterium]